MAAFSRPVDAAAAALHILYGITDGLDDGTGMPMGGCAEQGEMFPDHA